MHINLALFRLNYLSLLGLGQVIAEREFPFSFFLRQLEMLALRKPNSVAGYIYPADWHSIRSKPPLP